MVGLVLPESDGIVMKHFPFHACAAVDFLSMSVCCHILCSIGNNIVDQLADIRFFLTVGAFFSSIVILIYTIINAIIKIMKVAITTCGLVFSSSANFWIISLPPKCKYIWPRTFYHDHFWISIFFISLHWEWKKNCQLPKNLKRRETKEGFWCKIGNNRIKGRDLWALFLIGKERFPGTEPRWM